MAETPQVIPPCCGGVRFRAAESPAAVPPFWAAKNADCQPGIHAVGSSRREESILDESRGIATEGTANA